MQISKVARKKSRDNMAVVGRLMAAFGKHQYTIQRWFDENNEILTTPKALDIIKSEIGLEESEILVPEKAVA